MLTTIILYGTTYDDEADFGDAPTDTEGPRFLHGSAWVGFPVAAPEPLAERFRCDVIGRDLVVQADPDSIAEHFDRACDDARQAWKNLASWLFARGIDPDEGRVLLVALASDAP